MFTVSATVYDGDYIKYSAENLPEGATFSGQIFSWTPTSAQAGDYSVTFSASDGEFNDSISVNISVTTPTTSTPASGETNTEDSSSAADSSDSEDSQTAGSSGGGSFVPMYGEAPGAESGSASIQSSTSSAVEQIETSEESPSLSESEVEAQRGTGISAENFEETDAAGGVTGIESSDVAKQVDFLRSIGFKDEHAIGMIKDGKINFDYFIYTPGKGKLYVGTAPYKSYAEIVKTIARERRHPVDFYYANSVIKKEVFYTYTKPTDGNNVSIYKFVKALTRLLKTKRPKDTTIKRTDSTATVLSEVPTGAEDDIDQTTIAAGKVGEENLTAYSRFTRWLRGVSGRMRTKISNLFHRKS